MTDDCVDWMACAAKVVSTILTPTLLPYSRLPAPLGAVSNWTPSPPSSGIISEYATLPSLISATGREVDHLLSPPWSWCRSFWINYIPCAGITRPAWNPPLRRSLVALSHGCRFSPKLCCMQIARNNNDTLHLVSYHLILLASEDDGCPAAEQRDLQSSERKYKSQS